MFADRVLSGMRPTGRMHIGHYHGALKNWIKLQEEYECLFFAADWHALTTHYETPETIAAIKKLGSKKAKRYQQFRTAFQEKGDTEALDAARTLLNDTQNLSLGDQERLFGYLEGSRRVILPEPQPLLTETPRVPGLDGQKMSKSYGNAIMLREDPAAVTEKIRTMQTDPARVRRTDPGNPEKCPVWGLHQIYSEKETQDWVVKGCTTAGIGCLECKQPVIDAIIREQTPIHERAQKYLDDPE